MTETEVRAEIVALLKQHPDRCLFTVHAKPRGKFVSASWPPKGWPDISGAWLDPNWEYHEARALFIEVKTPTGKIYQEQVAFINKAKAMGAIAFFANCVDDVKKELGI